MIKVIESIAYHIEYDGEFYVAFSDSGLMKWYGDSLESEYFPDEKLVEEFKRYKESKNGK